MIPAMQWLIAGAIKLTCSSRLLIDSSVLSLIHNEMDLATQNRFETPSSQYKPVSLSLKGNLYYKQRLGDSNEGSEKRTEQCVYWAFTICQNWLARPASPLSNI